MNPETGRIQTKPDAMSPEILGEIYAPVDAEILPLVDALRSFPEVTTLGSCCGHGKEDAWVDLAVDGLPALRRFIARMNHVENALGDAAFIDIGLNWSASVMTACDFEQHPEWIMLSLRVRDAPSKRLLAKVANAYRSACKMHP